jgi:arylsulfatase A-like enzyme
LSVYNPRVRFTPNLDRIKKRSLVFQRHHSECGQSGPAFASIFSGTQVFNHRVFANGLGPPDSVMLIGEAFGEAGYDVYSWLNQPVASSREFSQGVPEDQAFPQLLTAEDPAFQKILARLRDDPDYRVLAITNFSVTHGPYQSNHLELFCRHHPRECAPRRDRPAYRRLTPIVQERMSAQALAWNFPNAVREMGLSPKDVQAIAGINEMHYKSNVFVLDLLLGAVFREIAEAGLLEESVVAFTADHGETFYRENSHFKWTHGLQQAPEVLDVPFLLFAPGHGVAAGSYEGVTRSIDIFPTLAGLCGVELPANPFLGRNLAPAIRGQENPPHLQAFSHTVTIGDPARFPDDQYKLTLFPRDDPDLIWVSVRDGDWFYKLVSRDGENFQAEVYDLARDPGETENRFDPADPQHNRVLDGLWEYKRGLAASYRSGQAGEAEISPDALEALRSLGYIQ